MQQKKVQWHEFSFNKNVEVIYFSGKDSNQLTNVVNWKRGVIHSNEVVENLFIENVTYPSGAANMKAYVARLR